jgi:hypothetical protein
MVHKAIDIAASLQRPPFLLEMMTTPYVPCRITEQFPINVTLIVHVERSDPIHSIISQPKKTECRRCILVNQNATIAVFPASDLDFILGLDSKCFRPVKRYGYDDSQRRTKNTPFALTLFWCTGCSHCLWNRNPKSSSRHVRSTFPSQPFHCMQKLAFFLQGPDPLDRCDTQQKLECSSWVIPLRLVYLYCVCWRKRSLQSEGERCTNSATAAQSFPRVWTALLEYQVQSIYMLRS